MQETAGEVEAEMENRGSGGEAEIKRKSGAQV